jgi:hypothetical protein
MKTEALVEEVTQGWELRSRRAEDPSSISDGVLVGRDMYHHVIGLV